MAEYLSGEKFAIDMNNKIRKKYHESFVAETEWMNFLHGLQYLQHIVAQPLADLISEEIFLISQYPVNCKLFEIVKRIVEKLDRILNDSVIWQGDLRLLVAFLKHFEAVQSQTKSLEHIINQSATFENIILQSSLKLDEAFQTTNVANVKSLEDESCKLNRIINDENAQKLRKSILMLANKYIFKVEEHYENKNTNISKNLLKLRCFPYLSTKAKTPASRSKPDGKLLQERDFEGIEMYRLEEIIEVVLPLVKHIEESELNHAALCQSCTDITDFIFTRISTINTPNMDTTIFSLVNLTNCIYIRLSTKLRTTFYKLFHSALNIHSFLVPDFFESEPKQSSTNTEVAFIRFFGALIASGSGTMSPSQLISPDSGMNWLVRALQQLHVTISDYARSFASSCSFPQICFMIYHFLDICGVTLLKLFHDKALEVFNFLANLLSYRGNNETESKMLKEILSKLLQNQKLDCRCFWSTKQIRGEISSRYETVCYLEISIIYFVRAHKDLEQQIDLLDSDTNSQFILRVKALGIDRLRAIFNRLSTTKDSQQAAIRSLQGQILKAGNESQQMLQYTLIKIGRNMLKDCQEEFFCERDEGHPLKLARVICGLCKRVNGFREILRQQFFDACPLLEAGETNKTNVNVSISLKIQHYQ